MVARSYTFSRSVSLLLFAPFLLLDPSRHEKNLKFSLYQTQCVDDWVEAERACRSDNLASGEAVRQSMRLQSHQKVREARRLHRNVEARNDELVARP